MNLSSSHLIELAQRAKRLPHIVVAVILGPVLLIAGAVIGQNIAFSLILHPIFGENLEATSNSALQSGIVEAVMLGSTYLGILLVVWAFVRFYEKRPLWTLGLERAHAVRRYALGFAAGLLMMGAWTGVMWLSGALALEDGPAGLQGKQALAGVGVILLGWLIQGAVEEIQFRGWLMGSISARYSVGLGVAVSSILFGLLHGMNQGFGLLPLLNLCLYGLFMALWALKEGSIWGVCGLHSAWNWSQGNLFGLEVSGGGTGGGTLINLTQTGPAWLTGGAFGPEGGLGVFLLLLVGIGLLYALRFGKAPDTALPG